jgi:hypothetical protein
MSALQAALADVAQTSARLSRVSAQTYQNPYTALDWPPTVDPRQDWFSSPEQVTLAGTPE